MSDMPLDSRAFRNALGSFATGVTVVTARKRDGSPFGITANSFSSVSLDPPMVLWCLGRASDTYDEFMAAEHFAINVLREGADELSNRMAMTGNHAMDGLDFSEGEGGVPVISDALSSFECKVAHRYDGGDHVIMVGEVLRFTSATEGGPLVFFRGKYAAIS